MAFDLSFLWKKEKEIKIRFCFISGAITVIDKIPVDFAKKTIANHTEQKMWHSTFHFERNGTHIFIDMDKVEKLVIFEE